MMSAPVPDVSEKQTVASDVELPSNASSRSPQTDAKDDDAKSLDKAYIYLTQQNHGDADDGTVDINALRRKIDWRIVPIMFLCYTMQFIDKVNVNVSKSPRCGQSPQC